jgi:hypothetical protein
MHERAYRIPSEQCGIAAWRLGEKPELAQDERGLVSWAGKTLHWLHESAQVILFTWISDSEESV